MSNEQTQLTADDLEVLFSGKKPRRRNKAVSAIKYTLLFLLIAFVLFISINYQSISKQLSYWYSHEYKNSQPPDQDNFSSTYVKTGKKTGDISVPNVLENHIAIPDISIDAPVTWMVPNNEADTSKALQNGAIQLLGTALPGTTGNVFITAHSSNYAWASGNYKSLFALLDKLTVGQLVYVKYRNTVYIYKVYEKSVTKPSDTSVLNQGNQSILTLMTCTPVGTSLNRLIIKSSQIYPNPRNNVPNEQNVNPSSLPGIH